MLLSSSASLVKERAEPRLCFALKWLSFDLIAGFLKTTLSMPGSSLAIRGAFTRSESGAKIALNKARGGIGASSDDGAIGDDDDKAETGPGPGTDVGKGEWADLE